MHAIYPVPMPAPEVTVLRVAGQGTGIVYLSGLETHAPGSKGDFLKTRCERDGLPFTWINWQTPRTGLVTEWQSSLRRAFDEVARDNGPQVVIGHSFGGWMAAGLARDLEAEFGSVNAPLAGLILINPMLDATRLVAMTIGEEDRKSLQADPANVVPFRVPVIPGELPLRQAHLDDGEKHFFFDAHSAPPASVRTHIFRAVDDPLAFVDRSADYTRLAPNAVIEDVRGGHELMVPGVLKKIWAKAREMTAANANGEILPPPISGIHASPGPLRR